MSYKILLIALVIVLTALLTWSLFTETPPAPSGSASPKIRSDGNASPQIPPAAEDRHAGKEQVQATSAPGSGDSSPPDRDHTTSTAPTPSSPDESGYEVVAGEAVDSAGSQSPLLSAEDRLWEAGYVEAEVEAILESWDAAQRYAEDRHGPDPILTDNPPPRFHEEQHRYDEAVRSKMSNADYDAARYANDLTNRVEIIHLPDEPELILEGLMEGDLIRAVNGEPIYTVGDFMMWRRDNREALPMDPLITVERPVTGEIFQVRSPMGRVGILENIRKAPTPP